MDDPEADPTADGKGSGSGSVLGYPVAFLRTKELTTWKSPGGGKAPAPAGTMANPFGTVAVDKKRSLWYPRVQLSAIKPSFDVPELAARRLKPKDVDDVVVVVNISVFTNKSIADVIAALLAICALEPSMPRIIAEALEGSYDARPARHLSLVLSGLDVNTTGSVQPGGAVGGGSPAAAAAASGAAAGGAAGGGVVGGGAAAGVAAEASDGNSPEGGTATEGQPGAAMAAPSEAACVPFGCSARQCNC